LDLTGIGEALSQIQICIKQICRGFWQLQIIDFSGLVTLHSIWTRGRNLRETLALTAFRGALPATPL
jgi:hypothetical protein